MIVRLKRRSSRYRHLSMQQPYTVIGIEGNDLRIIDDAGRPYLYPLRLFAVTHRREPRNWVTGFGDDGERYAYPALLNKPGFFEDFPDEKPRAVSTFWRVVNRRLATSNNVA
jgi:hypothetical protein